MKQSKVMQNADQIIAIAATKLHFWNIVQCLINSTVLPVPKDKIIGKNTRQLQPFPV